MSNERQGFTDTRSFLTLDNDNIDISSIIPLAETDGTMKISLYGKSGTALTSLGLGADGKVKVEADVPNLDNIYMVLTEIAFSLKLIAGG